MDSIWMIRNYLKSAGLYGRDVVTGEEGYQSCSTYAYLEKMMLILNVAPSLCDRCTCKESQCRSL